MKLWQIKIANFYFKLTKKFTIIEWIVIIVLVILLFKSVL